MPFPTINGHSFFEMLELLFKQTHPTIIQMYEDVQRLKKLAHDHGWEIDPTDPTQTPIP